MRRPLDICPSVEYSVHSAAKILGVRIRSREATSARNHSQERRMRRENRVALIPVVRSLRREEEHSYAQHNSGHGQSRR